ncbi:L,D-transpeptidase [Catalinimonas sp. 4WD22]|uniref:L,D-transpeptidase n=1 Tax=Catalinimonas locisalis TaxID=3133978 RepID=UPI003100D052
MYLLLTACTHFQTSKENEETANDVKSELSESNDPIIISNEQFKPVFIIPRDIKMKEYFTFLDSVLQLQDSQLDYALSEHILIRANSWIIDTLVSYDYYERMKQGIFIYDQKEAVILHKGDTLHIPDKQTANEIEAELKNTIVDVNIPEYKLRIIVHDSTKYTFPVRVGRNEIKYLKTAGREVNLRTPIGEGEIVRIEKNPSYINPVTAKLYFLTQRDDGKYTKLPQIPFLEPMINHIRQGALIHPTTNPHTLGKAYSNGCIGTEEGAA